MEALLKLPDCQINPASSEQSYTLFYLHWLSFAVVKRRILLFFSDSMSSLEASGFKLEIDIVQNIVKDYTHLANSGKTIILCWIAYPVMLILVAMTGLTLQQNQLFRCPLQI